MLLKQQKIGDKDNHMLVPGRDIHTVNFKCYEFQKWGHLDFNLPNNNNNDKRQGQGRGKNVKSFFQVTVGCAKMKIKIILLVLGSYWTLFPL